MLDISYILVLKDYIMANMKQFMALMDSHIQGDNELFLSVALQVAASESRLGRKKSAEQLRSLVDFARSNKTRTTKNIPIPIASANSKLDEIFELSYPKTPLADVILSDDIKFRLDWFLSQQRQREKLRSFNKTPSSHILLFGPPGTGKTLTAKAIATELHLPLFSIRLDTLITRYMGETSSKLRVIFDQVASSRAVYFFDEFDAIGASRSSENDVGEMRRVLNTFLQFLEEQNSTDSIIIGATNHPELLDKAIFRRFDEIVEYDLPNEKEIVSIAKKLLRSVKAPRIAWVKFSKAALGLSQAEISIVIDEVIKRSIIDNIENIKTEQLIKSVSNRRIIKKALNNFLHN